jgi:hypothetical protein
MKFSIPEQYFPDAVNSLLAVGPIDLGIQYCQDNNQEYWLAYSEDQYSKVPGQYPKVYDSQFKSFLDRDELIAHYEQRGYQAVEELATPKYSFTVGLSQKNKTPIDFIDLNQRVEAAAQPKLELAGERLPLYSTVYKLGTFGQYAQTPGAPCCWKEDIHKVEKMDSSTSLIHLCTELGSSAKIKGSFYKEREFFTSEEKEFFVERTIFCFDGYSASPVGVIF